VEKGNRSLGLKGADPSQVRRRHILWLAILTLAVLAPFINRAFNIDEPLFVWTGAHIRAHPLDPYGFKVNWYEDEMGMAEVTKNPPLAAYYIALASLIFGWSEIGLHLAFLIPAVLAVLGTYALARRLCRAPLAAALMTLLTPVFLLSGATVMCDMLMLALWVWSVVLWMDGLEQRSHGRLAAAAVLTALCALTKYFGVSLIPLLLVYTVAKARGVRIRREAPRNPSAGHPPASVWPALHLLISIAILAVYHAVMSASYGRGPLRDAVVYATTERWNQGFPLLVKTLTGLSFLGGCVAVAFFLAHRLWPRRTLGIGALLIVAVGAGVLMSGHIGTFALGEVQGTRPWAVAAQFAFLAVAGGALLGTVLAELRHQRDSETYMLLLWLFGTFLFAAYINWTTNGRSLLPLAPPAAILLARRLERRTPAGTPALMRQLRVPLVLAGLFAVLVVKADAEWADASRTAAVRIGERFRGIAAVWFEGHWGFQYYMQKNGGRPADVDRLRLNPGDALILPVYNTNVRPVSPEIYAVGEIFDVPVMPCLSVGNHDLGAGYYADLWGPLPFALGRVGPDRYLAMALKKGH